MTMGLLNISPEIEETYHETKFLQLLESHLTYLKMSPNLRATAVSDHQSYKYEGDFYGLLDDLRIEKKFHYIVMRINGLQSSADYKGDKRQVIIPDFDEIQLLKNIFQTQSQ